MVVVGPVKWFSKKGKIIKNNKKRRKENLMKMM
jgi:hypothetical protein